MLCPVDFLLVESLLESVQVWTKLPTRTCKPRLENSSYSRPEKKVRGVRSQQRLSRSLSVSFPACAPVRHSLFPFSGAFLCVC